MVIFRMENVEAYVPCAVKLFKTRILEFKTRGEYIRDDHRFKDRLSKTNAMTVSNIFQILVLDFDVS